MGSFIGFLFGLPRFNSEHRKKEVSGDKGKEVADNGVKIMTVEKYSANSNLEEVSDWLTKIIIGVGLTQLNDLPEKVMNLSQKITQNLEIGGETAFILSFICFGVIFGFFIGYLVTKLYLEDIFEKRGGRY